MSARHAYAAASTGCLLALQASNTFVVVMAYFVVLIQDRPGTQGRTLREGCSTKNQKHSKIINLCMGTNNTQSKEPNKE